MSNQTKSPYMCCPDRKRTLRHIKSHYGTNLFITKVSCTRCLSEGSGLTNVYHTRSQLIYMNLNIKLPHDQLIIVKSHYEITDQPL